MMLIPPLLDWPERETNMAYGSLTSARRSAWVYRWYHRVYRVNRCVVIGRGGAGRCSSVCAGNGCHSTRYKYYHHQRTDTN